MPSLSELYKQALPAHQRLYLSSIGKAMTGRTDVPITEQDFTPAELQQFKELMQFHQILPGNAFGTKHVIGDYDEYGHFTSYKDPKSDAEAYPYTTDLPQRLGRFSYEELPDAYQIKDTYDFKNPQRKPQSGLLAMLGDVVKRGMDKGAHGAAGALGEYLLYDRGVPVNIRVPK